MSFTQCLGHIACQPLQQPLECLISRPRLWPTSIMICQAILLPILGMASLFSVALAQASQRSSLDTTRDPLNWCGQDEKVHALGREDGLAALEALSKRSFDTEQASIHIPVNVFLVGTEEQRNSVKYVRILPLAHLKNNSFRSHALTRDTYIENRNPLHWNHPQRRLRQARHHLRPH